MKKELKLKFNMKDWISILQIMNLKQTDLKGLSPSYRKQVTERNKERNIFSDFLETLKKKTEDNKKTISKDYINNRPYPFPELIDCPKTKNGIVEKDIINVLKDYKHKEFYYKILEANNEPNYQLLVRNMSSESRRDNVTIKYDVFTNEDSLLNIFQSAIALCPPCEIQDAFEYFAEEYKQLEKIDSKKETKEKENQILSEFHKAMRQTDMFGNGHASSIIYSLWHASDIPIRAFQAVTEHVKELKEKV